MSLLCFLFSTRYAPQIHFQSKSWTFGNTLIAVVRHIFYFEGEQCLFLCDQNCSAPSSVQPSGNWEQQRRTGRVWWSGRIAVVTSVMEAVRWMLVSRLNLLLGSTSRTAGWRTHKHECAAVSWHLLTLICFLFVIFHPFCNFWMLWLLGRVTTGKEILILRNFLVK